MNRKTFPQGQIPQHIYSFYIILLSLAAANFMKSSPVFPCMESAIPTFKNIHAAVRRTSYNLHKRPEYMISDWIANLSALMYGEVDTRW